MTHTEYPGDPWSDDHSNYSGNLLDVAENITSAPTDWRTQAEEALRLAIASCNEFTTDDLRHLGAPDLEVAKEQSAFWGSLAAAASRAKRIRRVGYRPSDRPSANGRPVSVWIGVAA